MESNQFKMEVQAMLDQLLAKPITGGRRVSREEMMHANHRSSREVRYAWMEDRLRTALRDANNSSDPHRHVVLLSLREDFDNLAL